MRRTVGNRIFPYCAYEISPHASLKWPYGVMGNAVINKSEVRRYNLGTSEFDRIVFDSGLVRIGAFRCHPSHPSFHDSGPPRNCCFVFPRTAVEIQHEHEAAFIANPNVVTFYNKGQAYLRNAISPEGDQCDWFGVDIELVRDAVRTFDSNVDADPDRPFRFPRGWCDAHTYLLQRQLFQHVLTNRAQKSLAIEEVVVYLLERVIQSVYRTSQPARPHPIPPRHRSVVCNVELVLSERLEECLTLKDIAGKVELSVYHLCRMFRSATGSTMHQYRQKLRVRRSLEDVVESNRSLVDIALDGGFSSHSHFASSFCREFGQAPSTVRDRKSYGSLS
jgi:AraC-like DNA-binding protein